ncbi:MAG: hypothetical protein Q9227_003303 [Pyrenula ochraceoflavens]
MAGSTATTQAQVRLQLTTRDTALTIPETGPILVPTTFRRPALSALVNNLLESEKPIPLEFLINGNVLRTTLDDYLTRNGISSETTLSVEYAKALIPPRYIGSYQEDGWISAVDVLSSTSQAAKWCEKQRDVRQGHERILTANYDKHIRITDASLNLITTSPFATEGGHAGSVKAAKFISSSQVVSGGRDIKIQVWEFKDADPTSTASLIPKLHLYGHKKGVNSIAVHGPSNRVLSACEDGTIGLWTILKSSAPEAPANILPHKSGTKRQKPNPSVTVPQRGPLSIFEKHEYLATDVSFDTNDSTVGYSTSWDHTLQTWDLVTGAPVSTRISSASLNCLQQMPELNLIGAGSLLPFVTMIDPRESAAKVSAMTLQGHENSVSSLASDPDNPYRLVSGSHDGTCKIWDLRSTQQGREGAISKPLFEIRRKGWEGKPLPEAGEGIKVFGVCWDRELGIVSVGEDRRVQFNKGQ